MERGSWWVRNGCVCCGPATPLPARQHLPQPAHQALRAPHAQQHPAKQLALREATVVSSVFVSPV